MLDNTKPLRYAETLDLPDGYKKYVGLPHIGQPAVSETIDINTPLHEVQRPLKPNSILKHITMIGTIDWNMIGIVTAVEIGGQQFVIDGQHRLTLLKTFAPGVDRVPAHIIRVDRNNEEYAAKLFAYLNGVASTRPSQEEILWAEWIAREPHAIRIATVLEQAGLTCGMINEGHMTVSRATIEACMKLGIEETLYAAELIKAAYPERKECNQLLHGMVTLLSMPQYRGYMNNLTLGKMFRVWFVEHFADDNKYKEALFVALRPATAWQIGIAYGLSKKFRYHMERRGKLHHVPAIDAIRKRWQRASKRDDE